MSLSKLSADLNKFSDALIQAALTRVNAHAVLSALKVGNEAEARRLIGSMSRPEVLRLKQEIERGL